MEEEKFTTLNDLYNRLLPAINTKIKEFKHNGINDITPLFIWEYLLNNKWKFSKDLRLYELVDHILNIDYTEFKNYITKIGNHNER